MLLRYAPGVLALALATVAAGAARAQDGPSGTVLLGDAVDAPDIGPVIDRGTFGAHIEEGEALWLDGRPLWRRAEVLPAR